MEEENKDQNNILISEDNENERDQVVPGRISGEDGDEEQDDDDESMGHESLTEDQEMDIDEYEDSYRDPVAGDDYSGEEEYEDEEEDSEDEGDSEYENDEEYGKNNDEEEPSFYDDEEKKENDGERDSVVISKSKLLLIKKLLSGIKDNSDRLSQVLSAFISEEDEEMINISERSDNMLDDQQDQEANKIIEGVFDGENMIGPDGKQYSVPSNYASKSKLVEGDILKLTITKKGTFVYKQIRPIERDRVVGQLEKSADGTYTVVSDGKRWRVLVASVTYFKGEPGDEAIILIPSSGESKWAAVENIIKNK